MKRGGKSIRITPRYYLLSSLCWFRGKEKEGTLDWELSLMAISAIGWAWSRAKLGLRETLWHFNKVSQALGLGSEDSSLFSSWRGEKWHKHQLIPDWKPDGSRRKIEDREKGESFTAFLQRRGPCEFFLLIGALGLVAWVLGIDGCQQASLYMIGMAQQPTLHLQSYCAAHSNASEMSLYRWAISSCQQHVKKDNTNNHTQHWSTYHCWYNKHGYINKDIDEETVRCWPSATHIALSLNIQRQLCSIISHQQLQSCDDSITKTDIRQDIIFSHHTYDHG